MLKAKFEAGPEMGNWKFVASLSKKLRKRTLLSKNYVLRFCFLAAGKRMLLRIRR
jgi:hypothetical protein